MRKLIIQILVFSTVICLQAHEYDKTITLNYPASELCIDTVDNLTRVTMPDNVFWFDTDSTMPMLPKLAANILLEPNVEVLDVNFRATNPVFWDQVSMEGCQLPVPTDSDYNISAHPATSSVSPGVTYLGDSEVRGHRIGNFEVFPFGYDVNTGLLWICQDITITLRMKSTQGHSPSLPSTAMTWQCDTARQWLKEMVCNAYDIDTLDSNLNIDVVPANKRYEYLIITNNALKPEFQRLSEWKNTKGVRTKIMTTEEIYQNYPDTTPQRQIKRAIISMRDSTCGTLRYVLLGGDETVIPIQLAYIQATDSKGVTYCENTPCDLYYASLKELDWDTNGNGLYGELEDSISLVSDLDISRMPVSNRNNAEIQITRILNYEKKSNHEKWFPKLLMAGCKISGIYSNSRYGDSISDSHWRGEDMKRNIDKYWDGQTVLFFDTGTNFPGNDAYDVTAENLQAELSRGYPFLHMDTHGSTRSWKMEFQPNYTASNAKMLDNASHTIVLTTACNTSQFDDESSCLAEEFLNNPSSGVVAYYGSSRFGWSWSSNSYNENIFKFVFKNRNSLATALSKAKNLNLYNTNNYSSRRWLTLSINGFSDPEMPVVVRKLENFNNIIFHYDVSNLIVNEHLDSCRTCVMSINDMGQAYYQVKKNVSRTWNQFSGLDELQPYSVCVTRDGYVPYLAQIHHSFFMQNDTLEADSGLHIITQKASIGQNVTDAKPQGQVVISGSMTVQCPAGVLIDKGTTINKGALFQVILHN